MLLIKKEAGLLIECREGRKLEKEATLEYLLKSFKY